MARYQQYEGENSAPVRRYGEGMLASGAPMEGSAGAVPAAPKTTRKVRISWGRVIKDVALIAGVIVVGIVIFQVAGPPAVAAFEYLNTVPVIGPAMAAIGTGIGVAADMAVAAGFWAWGQITTLGAWASTAASTSLQSGGFAALTPDAVAAAEPTVKIAAGAAAVVLANKTLLPVVTPHLANPIIVEHHPIAGMEDGTASALAAHNSHSASTAAKISHHAVEEPRVETSWRHRLAASSAYQQSLADGGSHADAIRAAHDGLRSSVKSRSSKFSEQLSADRAALDAALKDNVR